MSHSVVQQATHGSTQTVSFTLENMADMQELLRQLKNELQQLNLSEQDRNQAMAEVATMEAQLVAPRPNTSIIQAAGHGLRQILLNVAGNFATDLVRRLIILLW